MFAWELLDGPDVPFYEKVSDGPCRLPFLIPCPIQGPDCSGYGGAYRIDRREGQLAQQSESEDGQEAINGTGAMRFGRAGLEFLFGCPNCRKKVLINIGTQQEAERLKNLEQAWESIGVPRRYKDFSLNRCVDSRVKGVPGASARKPGVTYITNATVTGGTNDAALQAVTFLRSWRPGSDVFGCLLIGTKGSGKSHLAYAWAMDRVRERRPVWCMREKALHSGLQAPYDSQEYRSARAMIERATKTPMLLWDDLAHAPDGEDAKLPKRLLDEIDYLIDKRYNDELPLIATTNANWTGLSKRLGDGVVSRLKQLFLNGEFDLTGFDWRQAGESKRL